MAERVTNASGVPANLLVGASASAEARAAYHEQWPVIWCNNGRLCDIGFYRAASREQVGSTCPHCADRTEDGRVARYNGALAQVPLEVLYPDEKTA